MTIRQVTMAEVEELEEEGSTFKWDKPSIDTDKIVADIKSANVENNATVIKALQALTLAVKSNPQTDMGVVLLALKAIEEKLDRAPVDYDLIVSRDKRNMIESVKARVI